MRKLLLILLFFVCCFPDLWAKDGEKYTVHEVYVGIGFEPLKSAIPENAPYFDALNASYLFENEDYSETFTAGYMISLSRNMAIGLSYSTFKMKSELWINAAKYRTAVVSAKYNIWMLDARYKWLQRGGLSLYSRAGAGVINMKVDEPEYDDMGASGSITGWENQTGFAWQVVPVGVQYTFFKHIGLFAEGGIGVESCFSAGLKLLF